MKEMLIPAVIGALGKVSKGLDEEAGRVGNRRMNRQNSKYSIVKIGQNTVKSPGDMRRLGVIPVNDHQLMLPWKTLKK